jgi:predicted methyltransferase
MKKLLALALVLAACGKSKPKEGIDPGTPEQGSAVVAAGSGSGSAVAAGSGSGSAAPAPIPPYTPAADVPQAIKDAVAATDRSDDDRRLDAGRKPAEVLAFFHVVPGFKIGELFAGGGYTTELMARVVGPTGKVFAQNTQEVMDKFAAKPWAARAAKPVMANVVSVVRATDDPMPPEAKDLDLVVTVLNYHDFVNMKVDRAKMNKAVLATLKKGGYYGIVDSSAPDGSGLTATETLHRIDQKIVESEIKAAGFKPAGESNVLRNPDDKRDWSSSPKAAGEKRGTSDRFVLLFQKP